MSTTSTSTTPRKRARRDTSPPAAASPARGDLLGYARVSTDQQNLALQLDALEQAGCRRVFRDVGSGSLKHRPQLDECLSFLQAGDTLVVWRLDRLGRGLKHLIELVEQLEAREIAFRSLTEDIDTTTSATSASRERSTPTSPKPPSPAPSAGRRPDFRGECLDRFSVPILR